MQWNAKNTDELFKVYKSTKNLHFDSEWKKSEMNSKSPYCSQWNWYLKRGRIVLPRITERFKNKEITWIQITGNLDNCVFFYLVLPRRQKWAKEWLKTVSWCMKKHLTNMDRLLSFSRMHVLLQEADLRIQCMDNLTWALNWGFLGLNPSPVTI